jgi:hypothetical protein
MTWEQYYHERNTSKFGQGNWLYRNHINSNDPSANAWQHYAGDRNDTYRQCTDYCIF